MRAAARMIRFAFLATAVCLEAGGCIYSGGQPAMFDDAEPPAGLAPVTIHKPNFVTPVPPPTGFSSTYRKYLMDRQREARRAEQESQAKASGKSPTEKEIRPESR
jgi:hypothetical protein